MRVRSASERGYDAFAMLLLLGGAVLYLYAFFGMRSVERNPVPAPGQTAVMQRFDLYWKMSWVGISLVTAGVLTGAWSWWRHRAEHRQRPQ